MCIFLYDLIMHKEGLDDLNPGGSLASTEFPVPDFNSVEDIDSYLSKVHGYEYSNNLFFSDELNGKNVAEVGCGHGLISILLSRKCKNLTGYDVDQEAIVYAKALGQKLKIDNIEFRSYNGAFSPNEKTYDVVISMDVIEHVNDPMEFLKNLYKILRPEGVLIIGTPNGLIAERNKCIIKGHSKFHIMEYTPNELLEFLYKSGFAIKSCFSNKNISGGGYAINPAKKVLFKVLCSIHLFDLTLSVLSFFQNRNSKNDKMHGNERNSSKDWSIKLMSAKEINERNCDVIIFKAIKTNTRYK